MFAKVISRQQFQAKSNFGSVYLTNLQGSTYKYAFTSRVLEGAQWLSGRVLDSRPKGRGFEPHQRHCVVVLEQDTFILA